MGEEMVEFGFLGAVFRTGESRHEVGLHLSVFIIHMDF
jgi:hypothetical protein